MLILNRFCLYTPDGYQNTYLYKMSYILYVTGHGEKHQNSRIKV